MDTSTTFRAPDGSVYVHLASGGFLVVEGDGRTSDRLNLPDSAFELVDPEDALPALLEAITDVPMPKKVREQIADRLGVDIEDVGRSNARSAA